MSEMYEYRSKRVVVLLATDAQMSVALNVLAHLSLAIGGHADRDLMGRPMLMDASQIPHLGIAKYPIIVKKASRDDLRSVITQARAIPTILLADYPHQMLTTGPDDELASALAGAPEPSLDYLGAALFGETAAVDQLCRKYPLWR